MHQTPSFTFHRHPCALIAAIFVGCVSVACGPSASESAPSPNPSAVSNPPATPTLTPAEQDAKRPISKRSATRWLLFDDAQRREALIESGWVAKIHAHRQAKYAGQPHLTAPSETEIADALARDVQNFFDRNQNLLATWSVSELIAGSARYFQWDIEQ